MHLIDEAMIIYIILIWIMRSQTGFLPKRGR
jgi:hypothetical protein